ncbi:MAG: hypothetical protein B7Z55_05915 [Planctomycetales bacterium 12-60-4]|nr:MAG: hypothetical protein B7Z55_05915 [Planctomycetales bacterium 12-60-4]
MGRRSWLTGTWACLAAQGLTAGVLAGEPYPYSDEWWAIRAQDPPGARQVEKDGKLWPPFPRPVGEKQHWVHKYHHAHYWPHPYNCDDRAFVRNILDIGDYHFDSDSQELNSVGRDHLQWIVLATPPQYRTIYVSQTFSSAADALRQANVEKTVREYQPDGGVPILLRYDRYQGRPAQEIDQLRRMELQSIPRPRLFTIGSTTGSGGSSSGGAAAAATSGGSQSGGSGSTTR